MRTFIQPERGASPGARPWLVALLVAGAALLLVFLLPLFIPMAPFAVDSAAYTAGFNGKVADLGAAAIGCAVLLAAWLGFVRKEIPPAPQGRMSVWFVAGAILAFTAVHAAICDIVQHAHTLYFNDAGYFERQLTALLVFHRRLYTEIEFPYGPLLLYPAAWVARVAQPHGGSLSGAYLACLIVQEAIGGVALAYFCNSFEMRPVVRRLGFLVLYAGSLVTMLGLNYTLFRFALPPAALLFVIRRPNRGLIPLWLAMGEMVSLLISPEAGIAFALGSFAFAALQWQHRRLLAAAAALLPLLTAATFLLLARAYTEGLIAFGRGSFNLPVEPLPHIVIYLFAVLWMVPRDIGARLRYGKPEAAALFPLYAFAVGMIPSTLGRCDPLHVFFGGLTVFVLSLVAVSSLRPRAAAAWLASLIFLVGWMHVVNLRLSRMEINAALHQGLGAMPATRRVLSQLVAPLAPTQAAILATPPDPLPLLDMHRLDAITGSGAQIALPLPTDPSIEQQLLAYGQLYPEYFASFENVLTQTAEERKVAEFNHAGWALLPRDPIDPWAETPKNVGDLQGFSFKYPVRRPLWLVYALFKQNLAERWRPVADFGGYRLYRRNDS